MNCTAPSSLTRTEALARLAACPALPRGERLNWYIHKPARPGGNPRNILEYRSKQFGGMWENWFDCSPGAWRELAAPLRRAREERQHWRKSRNQLMRLLQAEQTDSWDDGYQVGINDYRPEDIGAALLAFFEDLAILCRKTPAPCPWCGGGDLECLRLMLAFVQCRDCQACGPDSLSVKEAIQKFNRVAVPMAFRRMAQGDVK